MCLATSKAIVYKENAPIRSLNHRVTFSFGNKSRYRSLPVVKLLPTWYMIDFLAIEAYISVGARELDDSCR